MSFGELQEEINASSATVRRDLEQLAVSGRIERLEGGAKLRDLPPSSLSAAPLETRASKNLAEKMAIGKAAVQFCRPGESIIVHGGSTTIHMCRHVAGLGLRIVTNSLDILAALRGQPSTRVNLLAGTFFRDQNMVLSSGDDDGSGHFGSSTTFMGAAAIGRRGVLQNDELLLSVERRLAARASRVVLLVDSSKFRAPSGQVVCDLAAVSAVVTDEGISDLDARLIRKSGAKLVVAKQLRPAAPS
jgi:DeoR family ulaG and ulaABCDEF operon transcriptional repressor